MTTGAKYICVFMTTGAKYICVFGAFQKLSLEYFYFIYLDLSL
jgi:hypothetical protein